MRPVFKFMIAATLISFVCVVSASFAKDAVFTPPSKEMKSKSGAKMDGGTSTEMQKSEKAPASVRQGKPQTKCPVMGGPVNKKVFTDYKGKRIYFCCDSCISAFLNNPDKYLKDMADEGVILEDSPASR